MFIVYIRHKQVHEFYIKRNIINLKCLNVLSSILGALSVLGLLLVGSFQVSPDLQNSVVLVN